MNPETASSETGEYRFTRAEMFVDRHPTLIAYIIVIIALMASGFMYACDIAVRLARLLANVVETVVFPIRDLRTVRHMRAVCPGSKPSELARSIHASAWKGIIALGAIVISVLTLLVVKAAGSDAYRAAEAVYILSCLYYIYLLGRSLVYAVTEDPTLYVR